MGRLFGTDGARGIANQDLTCELAMQIGRAAACVLTRHTTKKPKIVIGKDTRISSSMLENALVAGICSVGVDVELLGELPTPAVAWLVNEYHADAGVMISASHNPVEFNGIKLFSNTGYKLPDDIEAEIEELILDHPEKIQLCEPLKLGRVSTRPSAHMDYVNHVKSTIDDDLSGMNIAIDCANGSASRTAELLFSQLGAVPHFLHATPTGLNINKKCGSTHMESLREFMLKNNCELAIAFDGDADRCLFLDENGDLVDGDQIMAIVAKYLKERGQLAKDTVVATVMSNFGMHAFAKENDIQLVCTSVGDRYVLEEMLKSGYIIGGEQSGHIIFHEYAQTGDGQLTAVQVLSIYKEAGMKMSELASCMKKYPQVIEGVPADAEGKEKLKTDPVIQDTIREVEQKLGDSGRVLVRPSGTEPLIRVMIEGKEEEKIQDYCRRIRDVISERIG
ncbi:MAG: phosphoglucosamine mutase [Massiliimalia sp.]|jgi:phosphoglucosamine mutase